MVQTVCAVDLWMLLDLYGTNCMCSRPVDVIGPVWYKRILSAICNEGLKTKFYLKPLAPIKFADAAALFICNRFESWLGP
jgi:hypothetical protein